MDDLETEDLFVQRRFMAIAKPTPVIIRKAHQHFPWIASTPLLKKIFDTHMTPQTKNVSQIRVAILAFSFRRAGLLRIKAMAGSHAEHQDDQLTNCSLRNRLTKRPRFRDVWSGPTSANGDRTCRGNR